MKDLPSLNGLTFTLKAAFENSLSISIRIKPLLIKMSSILQERAMMSKLK
jgi:hypothetical protein